MQPRQSLIEYKTQDSVYLNYYEGLIFNDSLYVVLVSDDGGRARIVFDKSHYVKNEFISRIFHLRSDAERYFNDVKNNRQAGDRVVLWETKWEDIVCDYNDIIDTYGTENQTYKVISTMFIDGFYRDIEVFWQRGGNVN